MHKKKKFPALFVLFAAVALVVGIVLSQLVLPVPETYKWMAFYLITVAAFFLLVLISAVVKKIKRGRRGW